MEDLTILTQLSNSSESESSEEVVEVIKQVTPPTKNKGQKRKAAVTPQQNNKGRALPMGTNRRIQLLEDDLARTMITNEDLEEELKEAHAQIKALTKQNKKLDKMEKIRNELDLLKSQKKLMKAQHDAALSRANAEAEREINKVRAEKNRQDVQIDSLSALVTQKDREITNLNKRLAGYDALQQKNVGYMMAEEHKMREAEMR